MATSQGSVDTCPSQQVYDGQPQSRSQSVVGSAVSNELHSPTAWLEVKDQIQALYFDQQKTLKEVRQIMADQGFKASERMYKARIASWGLAKNSKDELYQVAIVLHHARKESGKQETAFVIHSRPKYYKDIRKYIKARKMSEDDFLTKALQTYSVEAAQQYEKDYSALIRCFTPKSDEKGTLTTDTTMTDITPPLSPTSSPLPPMFSDDALSNSQSMSSISERFTESLPSPVQSVQLLDAYLMSGSHAHTSWTSADGTVGEPCWPCFVLDRGSGLLFDSPHIGSFASPFAKPQSTHLAVSEEGDGGTSQEDSLYEEEPQSMYNTCWGLADARGSPMEQDNIPIFPGSFPVEPLADSRFEPLWLPTTQLDPAPLTPGDLFNTPDKYSCDRLSRGINLMTHQTTNEVPVRNVSRESRELDCMISNRFDEKDVDDHHTSTCFTVADSVHDEDTQTACNTPRERSLATGHENSVKLSPPISKTDDGHSWKWVTRCFLACHYLSQHDQEMSDKALAEASFHLDEMVRGKDPMVALAMSLTLQMLHMHDQGDVCRKIMRSAYETVHDALGDDDPLTVTARFLAYVSNLQMHGREITSDTMLAVHNAYKRDHDAHDPRVIASLYNYGYILNVERKCFQAEFVLKQVLDVSTVALGANHLQTISAMTNLSRAIERQGKERIPEAISLLNRALSALEELLGKQHPRRLETMRLKALLLQRVDGHDEGEVIELFWSVLDGRVQMLGKKHIFTQASKQDYVSLLKHLDKWDKDEENKVNELFEWVYVHKEECSNESSVVKEELSMPVTMGGSFPSGEGSLYRAF